MRGLQAIATTLLLSLSLSAASAGDDIHIAGKGKRVNQNPWTARDSAGFNWDIYTNTGQINDGTNDAYDGGMQLQIAGNTFQANQQAIINAEGNEIEIGPWTVNNLRVYRRVYVDAKAGYCRWIDIFENTTSANQNVSVQHYSNMGNSNQMAFSSSGKGQFGKGDWGIVTAANDSDSRPAIVHILAAKNSKVFPEFRWNPNDDNTYAVYQLSVPAGKTVALCAFHAQRRPYAEAQKFLKDFNTSREMAKVPTALRRIILNMGGGSTTLGAVELPRNDQADLAVLPNGDELLGSIANERFAMATRFGEVDLAADRVLGVSVPEGATDFVHLVLTDGQVVGGKLTSVPLKLKLANGNIMDLQPSKIRSLAYRITAEKKAELAVSQPTAVLRDGQRLFYDATGVDYSFLTQYGVVKLSADDVRSIEMGGGAANMHHVIFRNESVLAGLLTAEDFKLKLDLGPTLEAHRGDLARLVFPGEAPAGSGAPTVMTLVNEDTLIGRLADEALSIRTEFGVPQVKPAEIAELTASETALGKVQVKLVNGSTLTGDLQGKTLRFKIEPGPEVPVFVGHIRSVTAGQQDKPAPAPTPAVGRPHPRVEAAPTPYVAEGPPMVMMDAGQPTTRATTRPTTRSATRATTRSTTQPATAPADKIVMLRRKLASMKEVHETFARNATSERGKEQLAKLEARMAETQAQLEAALAQQKEEEMKKAIEAEEAARAKALAASQPA